jgi:hypothetical protein
MADVTPPVGLAAYAAAAISGADPVATGVQGFRYEIRTALLPFLFIFNTELLLIDVQGVFHFLFILTFAITAMMVFVAATQQWLLIRTRWWEALLLLLISFTLFRPGYWLDRIQDPFVALPAAAWKTELDKPASPTFVKLKFKSQDRGGDEVTKVLRVGLAREGTVADRLGPLGLGLLEQGAAVTVQAVRFGSVAKRIGLDNGDELLGVEIPAERYSKYWFFIPALLLLALVTLSQLRRRRTEPAPSAVASGA